MGELATRALDWSMLCVVHPRGLRHAQRRVGRSIDGISLDDFEICGGAVGRVVEVCAYIKGLGTRTYKFALVEKPSDRAKKAPPTWKGERPVPPGENVSRRDRLRYLEFAARHPYVRRHVWLLSELLKREWYREIIPRHATIAAATGCSMTR